MRMSDRDSSIGFLQCVILLRQSHPSSPVTYEIAPRANALVGYPCSNPCWTCQFQHQIVLITVKIIFRYTE